MIVGGSVEPIRRGRIGDPRMQGTDVIGDDIEKDFHVQFVRRSHQILIVLQSAEMGIDGIEIDGAVAVVILSGAIFDDRREPHSGDAEIFQVSEMILHAAQIAAVPRARFGAVMRAGKFRRFIVGGIAVGETVGHDEIEDVVEGQSLISGEDLFSRGERQFEGSLTFGRADATDSRAGFEIGIESQPNEQVMAIGRGLRATDNYCGQVAIGVGDLKIFSDKQEHDIGSEIDPPVRRLDFGDGGCIGIGIFLGECRKRGAEERRRLQCERKNEANESRNSTRHTGHKHFPASLADLKSEAARNQLASWKRSLPNAAGT